MAMVGVKAASQSLGVSPRRVRQMIADGDLPASRVGRVWVISEPALNAARRPAHRPWKPASAWAVLAAADGSPLEGIPAYERHRAFERLKRGLAEIVGCLAERAKKRCFYAHPADVARILASRDVVRSGPSVAVDYGGDLVGPGPDEAYVSESSLGQVLASYHLEERNDRPNVVFRVVADDDWPFSEGVKVAPRAVVAVDLLESHDDRSRRTGRELLAGL